MKCITKGKTRIRCFQCGRSFHANCNNIELKRIGKQKRISGDAYSFDKVVTVKCPKCKQKIGFELFYYAYPVGGYAELEDTHSHSDCIRTLGHAEILKTCEFRLK